MASTKLNMCTQPFARLQKFFFIFFLHVFYCVCVCMYVCMVPVCISLNWPEIHYGYDGKRWST